jgi:uncharacterized protein DUF3768
MSTPYDDEPIADGAVALATRIRELNDAFRRDPSTFGVRIGHDQHIVTNGVAARGLPFVARAVRAVLDYTDFNEGNDPYGEHDFGRFTIDDAVLFWKIDYFDNQLKYGSPNPADPDITRRVLTIMLAEEY